MFILRVEHLELALVAGQQQHRTLRYAPRERLQAALALELHGAVEAHFQCRATRRSSEHHELLKFLTEWM